MDAATQPDHGRQPDQGRQPGQGRQPDQGREPGHGAQPRAAGGSAPAGDVDDVLTDLGATAAIIEAQRARVVEALDVDARLLFGAWGTAWLLGFGLLWAAAAGNGQVSEGVAGLGFAALLVAALVVTTVHLARRSTGLRGASATQGAMYGWSWMLAGLVVFALAAGLDRAEAPGPVIGFVMTVVPALVAGVLYMAGGALWQDRNQFGLGAWILLVTVAAAFVGRPHMMLVMALAGGGGMLVVSAVEGVRRRGRPGRLVR